VALKRRFDAIDGIKAQLQTLVDASKDHHRVKVHTRMKTAAASPVPLLPDVGDGATL